MKHTFTFLLAACLCICSCTQLQEFLFDPEDPFNLEFEQGNPEANKTGGITSLADRPATFWEILTEPDFGMITVGKEGGEVEVLAYVHELNPADSVSRAHKLKNEYFYFGPNLEGKKIEELFPFVSLKSREQVDDYTVRYTFSFLANDTDKSRHFGCRIYDLTYYKDYGDNRGYTMAGVGHLDITQTAE